MTTTLRTWIAALALGFSAFVLTLSSPADALADRALLPLFAIFVVAWMVAVGERATIPRGGLRVTRFPLGPRMLQVRPGLAMQFIVLLGVLALVAGWQIAGWAAIITAAATIHSVRKMAWYVVPAAWVVNTLATMPEFHTLGDLVKDAGEWTKMLVIFGLQALIICGPLLRTDVGGRLPFGARVATIVAGLPAWGAAFLIFSHTLLGGHYLDAEALVIVLLAGGLLQSLLLATVTWLVSIDDRSADSLPAVSAQGVGLALMPMLLPILACVALFLLPLPAQASFGGSPPSWIGLMLVLLIVPAALAVPLIGAALDRLDGEGRGVTSSLLSGALLSLWFLFGPLVLARVYGPGGAAEGLRASFDTHANGAPLAATILPGSSPLSGHAGGQLALFGLPAADLCRALTLMLFGLGALCARYTRHARLGQRPVGWAEHFALLAVSAVGAWLLVPRIGAVGAPLACAGASAVLLAVDLFHREIRVKSPELVLAEALAREEAALLRRRAERAAMAQATPREIVG